MMRRLTILLLLVLAGCASMGHETVDNPHITPTSKTGVTSVRGQNVYEKIPEAAPATTTAR